MKSGERVLRALIREVAAGMEDLPWSEGPALAVETRGGSRYYVLYNAGSIQGMLIEWEEEFRQHAEGAVGASGGDPAAREQEIEEMVAKLMARGIKLWKEESGTQIMDGTWPISAMMQVSVGGSEKYPQWGASTVQLSAAHDRMGPLMYDIVMSQEGGLVPDRSTVSSAAKRVWTKYKDSRPDVKAKPLDNPARPRTPSIEDDTRKFHPDDAENLEEPQNPLNYAYFLTSSPPNVAGMISAHKTFEPTLKKYGLDIVDMAINFFATKYDTARW